MGEPTIDELRERARDSVKTLARAVRGRRTWPTRSALVEELRNARDYDEMGQLAEAVSRRDPKDAKNRRLYAQYLIDTGKATAAIDMLTRLARAPAEGPSRVAEATGLLGRAYKQIFFDAGDKTSPGARGRRCKQAIAAYREPLRGRSEREHLARRQLLALLDPCAPARPADRAGAEAARTIARRVVGRAGGDAAEASATSGTCRRWPRPRSASATGTRVERHVRAYAAAPDAKAFQIASTLRQFTQVWDLEAVDERGRGLVDILRARLLQLPGGDLELDARGGAALCARSRTRAKASSRRCWARTGRRPTGGGRPASTARSRWRRCGSSSAGGSAPASSCARGALGLEPADELLVLTNFHVVNAARGQPRHPAGGGRGGVRGGRPGPGLRGRGRSCGPRRPSGTTRACCGCGEPVAGIAAAADGRCPAGSWRTARVYVIGHPGGRDLAFSFQDNELLDHEGPPEGKPQIPGVCRVHYRAPTEGGSSGSPVFNARLWEVIALHHKGGKLGMPRLNGEAGTYAANEGISMLSIREGVRGHGA